MKMTMTLQPVPSKQWRLARQIGVEGAVFHFLSYSEQDPDFLSYRNLKRIKEELLKEELEFTVAEGDPIPLTYTKLGLEGRDAEIDRYCDFIRVLGDLEVPVVCYNFMAGVNWTRTGADIQIRGKALTSGFDYEQMKHTQIDTLGVQLTTELLWDNLSYFLDRVLPVAEQAGVSLALHPDDPPMENFCNIKRIVSSPEAYHRLFALFPSERNAMTFCQANIKLMGGDLYEMAETFGKMGKIAFVHFRDVVGDKYRFQETFHDDGPTDMSRMMQLYRRHCDQAPIRPDHVPTLEGEDNTHYGYTILGRLYAIGYMRGLMDAVGKPLE